MAMERKQGISNLELICEELLEEERAKEQKREQKRQKRKKKKAKSAQIVDSVERQCEETSVQCQVRIVFNILWYKFVLNIFWFILRECFWKRCCFIIKGKFKYLLHVELCVYCSVIKPCLTTKQLTSPAQRNVRCLVIKIPIQH